MKFSFFKVLLFSWILCLYAVLLVAALQVSYVNKDRYCVVGLGTEQAVK